MRHQLAFGSLHSSATTVCAGCTPIAPISPSSVHGSGAAIGTWVAFGVRAGVNEGRQHVRLCHSAASRPRLWHLAIGTVRIQVWAEEGLGRRWPAHTLHVQQAREQLPRLHRQLTARTAARCLYVCASEVYGVSLLCSEKSSKTVSVSPQRYGLNENPCAQLHTCLRA